MSYERILTPAGPGPGPSVALSRTGERE